MCVCLCVRFTAISQEDRGIPYGSTIANQIIDNDHVQIQGYMRGLLICLKECYLIFLVTATYLVEFNL